MNKKEEEQPEQSMMAVIEEKLERMKIMHARAMAKCEPINGWDADLENVSQVFCSLLVEFAVELRQRRLKPIDAARVYKTAAQYRIDITSHILPLLNDESRLFSGGGVNQVWESIGIPFNQISEDLTQDGTLIRTCAQHTHFSYVSLQDQFRGLPWAKDIITAFGRDVIHMSLAEHLEQEGFSGLHYYSSAEQRVVLRARGYDI
jgi:hypothetical protein